MQPSLTLAWHTYLPLATWCGVLKQCYYCTPLCIPSLHCRAVERLTFAHTQESLSLLERVSCCMQMNEPVLLVGETGVGKTAAVNYLAAATG